MQLKYIREIQILLRKNELLMNEFMCRKVKRVQIYMAWIRLIQE